MLEQWVRVIQTLKMEYFAVKQGQMHSMLVTIQWFQKQVSKQQVIQMVKSSFVARKVTTVKWVAESDQTVIECFQIEEQANLPSCYFTECYSKSIARRGTSSTSRDKHLCTKLPKITFIHFHRHRGI